MKVRLIKKKSIENFALQNPGSRSSFRLWLTFVKNADWARPEDVKTTFGSADLLGNGSNRVVFNISGNHYRMICKYHLGSHPKYTKLCHDNKQYTVDLY